MPVGAFYGQEATMPVGAFYGQEATMPAAIPPEGAFWNQEGAFYGQEAQTTRDCGKPYVSYARCAVPFVKMGVLF